MRPDLESIRGEIETARIGLNIAKAKQIPWFEFVEGGYRDRDSDATTYTDSGRDHSDSDRDEWLLRTAISLPIFSWAGNETALAKALLREAEFSESIALTTIRNEIRNALANYSDAMYSRLRVDENLCLTQGGHAARSICWRKLRSRMPVGTDCRTRDP